LAARASPEFPHEITSVPLAGVPSPRYTTSCTVVVLWPALRCAARLGVRQDSVPEGKNSQREQRLAICQYMTGVAPR